MGGYFSGGHNRKKSSTNRSCRIDSFWFNKVLSMMKKRDIDKFKESLSWTDESTIGFILYQDEVVLEYRTRQRDEKWKEIEDTIHFLKVPNNYGGNRLYFKCPYCWNRFRFLYMRWGYFRCRKCNDLNYGIQQGGKGFTVPVMRMERILDKLGVKENLAPIDMQCYVPNKPKGMHWKTYHKLVDKLEEAQDDYYCKSMKKMMALCKIDIGGL